MLNNRGFAVTGIMYVLLLLFIVMIFGMFMVLGSRKVILDNYKVKILEKIEQPPAIDDYVQDGMILWYDSLSNIEMINQLTINENQFFDLSYSLNTGTLVNFNFMGMSNWYDRYLMFDGIDDYINTGISGNSFGLDDDFSLEIYFKINEVEAATANSSVLLGTFNNQGFGIMWETTAADDTKYYLVVGARDNVGESFSERYEISNFSDYQHVVMIYSTTYGEIRLYVNGILISTVSSLSGIFAETLGDIRLGLDLIHDSSFVGTHTNMNLFAAKIYDRALSGSEIIRNYAIDQTRYK